MFKPGEIWKSYWSFDVFSKKRNIKNNDDDLDTIRIKRIFNGRNFTVLSSEFILPAQYNESDDPMAMLERYNISILYDGGVWWTEIPEIDLDRYEKVI